ncbi:MAG: penicillin-binding transpeptidase domain-containing protein [Bacillota bacterium]|nr:penicillin-binding transpeptidase domain-containing protein [Bacillota bacterium]
MRLLLRNIKIVMIVFALISVGLLGGILIQQYRAQRDLRVAAGENKAILRSRYASAGTIYSADGVALAHSSEGRRLYAADATLAQSLSQLVGDYTHNIHNTIEAQYQGQLTGTERNPFSQLLFDVTGRGLAGDDITLTIDSRLQLAAWNLLGDYRGAIVLIDYHLGAIRAMVSKPATSPENIINYENIPDTALFNRALMGRYAPGSSFKFVTAAAYMQSPAWNPDHLVFCSGSEPIVPNGVREHGEGHGELNMTRAFQVSCNHFYGNIALEAGYEKLRETAEGFAYNRPLAVDRLDASGGRISSDPFDQALLSWLGIGQPLDASVLYASPLQLALMAGAVGNGGVMMEPHIVQHLTNPLEQQYQTLEPRERATVLDPETNRRVRELMLAGIDGGTGELAAVPGYAVGGKTGTAEVEGQERPNAVFLAFLDSPAHPYAVGIVCENAGYASGIAAPMASELFRLAIQLRG